MTDAIRRQIVAFLHQLGAPPQDADVDLFATGTVKSMQLMELINHLEDAFGVRVDQRDIMAGRLRTIRSITVLVADRRAP
jgi:acyl carrier protein